MAREYARHESHIKLLDNNQKEIGNQMQWKKEEMCKRVCEALNNLIELYNSMLGRISDLIKAKGGATKYRLYDVGVQCCCVFIEMHLKYFVVFFIRMYLISTKCCLIIR